MRPSVPGEGDYSNIMDPMSVHNRTLRVWIMDVVSDEGFVTVDFDGQASAGRPASIPWLWASFPTPTAEGQKRYGAWGRYIPFKGDLLKATFDWDDKMHIVGYDTKYHGSNVSGWECGWKQITDASIGDDPLLLSQFRTLQSGEYDFMSIGGAYIYGAADGTLHLEGGPAQFNLVKADNSFNGIAQAWKSTADQSAIRYGQVRRFSVTPTPFGVGDIAIPPWNPDGSYVEHQVLLQKNLAGVAMPVARLAIGNVTTNLPMGGGAPDISTTTGQIKRFALDIYDESGVLQLYNDEVDMMGNQSVSAPTATQFNVAVPLAAVKYTSLSHEHTTSTSVKFTTGTSYEITTGGGYTLTTLGGNIKMTSSLSFEAISGFNISMTATGAVSVGGATISLTGGGTGITMMGGGMVKMGAGASSSMNFTPYSAAMAGAGVTFNGAMTLALSTLATALPYTTAADVAAVLVPIVAYINSMAGVVSAAENPLVRI